jgi:hypothetical protein
MKKVMIAGLVAALTFGSMAGEIVKLDFKDKAFQSYVAGRKCILSDNDTVLAMNGDMADKNNDWRNVVISLPFADPAGKKFKFSGELKTENMQGKFLVAVRLLDAEGKSIKYNEYTVTKDQPWQPFSKEFTADAGTVRMQFYLVARNMADASKVEVKSLVIEQLNVVQSTSAKRGESGENLLQYPGFENAAGWQLPATGSIEPKSGQNSTPALVIKELGIENPYARITVADIPGSRDYYFRAWIRSTKGGGAGPKLKIEFYNHEGKYIGGEYSPAFSVGQYGAWVKVEVKLSAPQDTANAVLLLRQFGSGESVFDDLEFISRELVPFELAVEQRSAYARKGGSLDSAAIMHMNRDPAVAKGMTATATVTDSNGNSVFTGERQQADKKMLKFPFRISTDKAERYTVTARLFNPDSSLLLETKDIIAIVKQPSSFTNGHYEVDGKPFFPIGIFHVEKPEKTFPLLRDAGFNAVQGTPSNDFDKLGRYMDLAAEHQIYVFLPLYADMKVKENFENSRSKMRFLKDHPALLSYWFQDEPDRWKTPTSELVELRWILNENDPKHPGSVMMFGSSTRFMEQQQAVDLIYVDPYPTRKVSLPNTEVRDEIERVKKAGKPIAIAIQAFEMLPHWVKPSSHEVENYVYQALVHGVIGVTYFSMHEPEWNLSTSDLWPSVKKMNREIAALAPVLLSKEMRQATWNVKSNADIDWVVANVDGETYLLAVNVTGETQTLKIPVAAGITEILPLFERGKAEIKNHQACEILEPFGTRVYRLK